MGQIWLGHVPGPAEFPPMLFPNSPGRDEGPASEPDEALVDECCLLPSQLLIPSLDWLPVSDGLVSRLQPKQPLRLQFGRAPALPSSATTLQLDGLLRCVGLGTPTPQTPKSTSGPPRPQADRTPSVTTAGIWLDGLWLEILSQRDPHSMRPGE